MKYEGKLNVLQHFVEDQHYAVAELDFRVEGKVLSVPSLPFVMMRLDHPHKKADTQGWRFEVNGTRYMVPPKELAKALKPYLDEENSKQFERFYDVFDNGKTD